ncbi:hypothetical protein RCL1_002427 [Eukaryota sp. TZLM3-RCL]
MPRKKSKHQSSIDYFYRIIKSPTMDPPKNHSLTTSTLYKCRTCPDHYTWMLNDKGFTNLLYHITSPIHSEEYKEFLQRESSGQTTLHEIVTVEKEAVSAKAINLYGWLELYVDSQETLSFVEKDVVRRHSSLDPICRNTLSKYVQLTYQSVFQKIAFLKSLD